uniref:Unannotated protein n=1 Tax=freshwater metagenome TaxID=449393 RepID=A0A6J5ZLZ6_9ZZZZ
MEKTDTHRLLWRQGIFAVLNRKYRVLKRAVVELHHVGARDSLPIQSAGQVDVNDVETSGAELQVGRLGVDDYAIPQESLADKRDVCARRTRPSARHVNDYSLLPSIKAQELDYFAFAENKHLLILTDRFQQGETDVKHRLQVG